MAPWFRGEGPRRELDEKIELPPSLVDRHADPAGYLADPGLVDAVNVSLHLGQPLLLTGQPGTGKTQLAYRVAWELGFAPPLKFETKSTSVSRDLFYTYDSLGRFHAAQTGEGSARALDHINFNALGLAILRANEPSTVAELIGDPALHGGKRRSVVLIDEIDKAPRDFPNDLLNEVEGNYFKIPELGNRSISAERSMRPVLIVTSNSEKNLPDAFLRRCVFYNIPFPDRQRLTRIVESRLGEQITSDRQLLEDSLEIFGKLRDRAAGLLRAPSTGEFLAWLQLLAGDAPGPADGGALGSPSRVEKALCTLIKTSEDRARARKVLEDWNASTKR